MDMQTFIQWLEIISTFAVLITLVYLAKQVHQGNLLLGSEARQAQVHTDQEHLYKFIEHPELVHAYTSKDPISDDARIRLNFWIIASIRAREFEWTQYQHGALDKDTWANYSQVIPFTLGTKRARQLWVCCAKFFNPEFVKVVNEILEKQPLTTYWDEIAQVS